MRYSSKLVGGLVLGLLPIVGAVLGPGCGSDNNGSPFPNLGPDGGTDANVTDSGGGFTGLGDGSTGFDKNCNSNLCLKRVPCSGGKDTTITGVVTDPKGNVPLYNAVVFIPNDKELKDIPTGPSCDRCDGTSNVYSGHPVSWAQTDFQGKFKLTNVPVNEPDGIPLVVQLGKWRREHVIVHTTACTNTDLADTTNHPEYKDLTHLPTKRSEGHIPKIAITTGALDSMECWPRRMGIDDTEFTTDTIGGDGRIHLYKGTDIDNPPPGNSKSTGQFTNGFNGYPDNELAFPEAKTLWGLAANGDLFSQYDMVILSCEGLEMLTDLQGKENKTPASRQNLYNYVSQGGRLFASHWHESWFRLLSQEQGLPAIGDWLDPDAGIPYQIDGRQTANVNTSFTKGQAFSQWLTAVGAASGANQYDIYEARRNLTKVSLGTPANPIAQDWSTIPDYPLSAPDQNGQQDHGSAVQFTTFNAPIGGDSQHICGRAVYTDLHVSSSVIVDGQKAEDRKGKAFPDPECRKGNLSSQEKALEFMLFDLSSCVNNDQGAPPPPVIP